MNLKKSTFVAMALALATLNPSLADEKGSGSLIKVGSKAPQFESVTSDKKAISLEEYKGKVVVLTFFATWCPECQAEMPHLQKEVWEKFKSQGLVVLAVGREHEAAELAKFKSDHKLTFAVVADPKKEIFEKYAKSTIPRNYVIAKDGKVTFEAKGYTTEELNALISSVESALKTKD